MITTGHMVVGGAIGVVASTQLTPSWAVPLALSCGILSHHLLDLIPHTDAGTFWPEGRQVPFRVALLVAFEFVAGMALVGGLYFSHHSTLAFLAGVLGGVLPDVLDEVPLWSGLFRRTTLGAVWHYWHLRLHCADMTTNWLTGIVIDAFVVAAGLWYLLTLATTAVAA